MKANSWILASVTCVLLNSACSSITRGPGQDPPIGVSTTAVDASAATIDASTTIVVNHLDSGVMSSTCDVTDVNADADHDGWTIAQGDCNDCDPNVNPGAIDVLHTDDGGAPMWGDEDCSGTPGDSAQSCDVGLTLADVNPIDAAKSIELCTQATMANKKYGVISAAYVRANGAAFAAPGLQVGIQSGFGPNVHVQAGQNMLALSSGHARTSAQAGACGSLECDSNASGSAPAGFPQDNPNCPSSTDIDDDVALQLTIRVPSNATGYMFNFKFYSFEFPDWVCNSYNDQFIALVTPAPQGAINGNISFDSHNNPVSVNLGYFDVCDPSSSSQFASNCQSGAGITCPTLPNPYCPLGVSDLQGTGFDTWGDEGAAGATRWLQTQAPATPGSVITIRFAIWDAGDQAYDSTVLIDNFRWIATGATTPTVPVSTQPIQ